MSINRMIKIVLFICILLFLASNVIQPSDSALSIDKVQSITLKKIDTSELIEQDNQDIKRFLSLVPSEYQDIVYLKQQDTMQASEIVIVKFKSHAQHAQFEQAINKHKEERRKVFDGYAPEEAQLLKESICTIHANYALFVVGKDAKTINNQFLSSF